MKEHHTFLQNLYMSAPIQEIYPGTEIEFDSGICRISMPVRPLHFHAADSLHGSVYFRLLDDSSWFAAATKSNAFLLTHHFETELLKPVVMGELTAVGQIVKIEGRRIVAFSELFNEEELVAKGRGQFVISRKTWNQFTFEP